eukprot:7878388-Lingulodinium_polyedra.AAC.1
MAFTSSKKLWSCGLCGTQKTYYKLMQSNRPEHALKRQEWDDEVKYLRICPTCELEVRKKEFTTWTIVGQRKDPTYATEAQVQKDLKWANKGQAYAATASHILQARKEIRDEEAKENKKPTSRKQRKSAILNRARVLAETLVEVIQEGGLFEAMAEAGRRIDQQA